MSAVGFPVSGWTSLLTTLVAIIGGGGGCSGSSAVAELPPSKLLENINQEFSNSGSVCATTVSFQSGQKIHFDYLPGYQIRIKETELPSMGTTVSQIKKCTFQRF